MITITNAVQTLQHWIEPRSIQEDDRRQEFIINILVLSSVLFSGVAVVIDIVIVGLNGLNPINVLWPIIVLGLFITMYIASRRGHFRAVIAVFIGCYLLIANVLQLQYGIGIPLGLLLNVFVIIITSILSSTRAAFFMTFIIGLLFAAIHSIHMHGIVTPDLSWHKTALVGIADVIVYFITFVIISVVTWLSNREIERSLLRARRSEQELAKERDLLEVRVQQRTSQLQTIQQERIEQLRHFANFGKRASGIMHDLRTPLTALTLNMGRLTKQIDTQEFQSNLEIVKESAESAQFNMKRIDQLLSATLKQIKTDAEAITFSVEDEIHEVLLILDHRVMGMNAQISTEISPSLKLHGPQLRFHQAITNLIGNALDAYEEHLAPNSIPTIEITGTRHNDVVTLIIKDEAGGIPEDTVQQIFTTFFTTKRNNGGTGLGLSIVKEVIEKDFLGTIAVESQEGFGTTFIITFPYVPLTERADH